MPNSTSHFCSTYHYFYLLHTAVKFFCWIEKEKKTCDLIFDLKIKTSGAYPPRNYDPHSTPPPPNKPRPYRPRPCPHYSSPRCVIIKNCWLLLNKNMKYTDCNLINRTSQLFQSYVKFIYFEKAKKFCKISTVDLIIT